jgi:hypothetical protein
VRETISQQFTTCHDKAVTLKNSSYVGVLFILASLVPHGMVVTPELLELPSSPTSSSTSIRPTSVDHELTTEITSVLPDPRLHETQVPGALIPQEKEKQVDGPADADGHDLAQGSPPTVSASVQFIGINYVPPESRDGQTTPLPAPPPASPPHPLPWESGPSPTSDGHVVIGLSTFVPKPCVVISSASALEKAKTKANQNFDPI